MWNENGIIFKTLLHGCCFIFHTATRTHALKYNEIWIIIHLIMIHPFTLVNFNCSITRTLLEIYTNILSHFMSYLGKCIIFWKLSYAVGIIDILYNAQAIKIGCRPMSLSLISFSRNHRFLVAGINFKSVGQASFEDILIGWWNVIQNDEIHIPRWLDMTFKTTDLKTVCK